MKAIVHTQYGSPLKLKIEDMKMPKPEDNEVRVKIITASGNATDFEIIRGDPIIRLANGFRSPKNWRLGCDFAGIVDKIGSAVIGYEPGDKVYADLMYQKKSYGAFAEYVCIPEKKLRKIPDGLSYKEACTIPQAGTLAVQAVTELVDLGEKSEVLINGAGGGVGTYALQLAKHLGSRVTVVDAADKFELLKSLGADHTIDYRNRDFTKIGKQYDLIIDVIARRGVFAHRRALKPEGVYTMVGGTLLRILQNGIFGTLISRFSSKKVGLLIGRPNDAESMEFLANLILEDKIQTVIDEVYPLEKIPEAIEKLLNGKVTGKLVFQIGNENE